MALGYKVAIGRKLWCAVERGGGTVNGKAAVARGSAAERLIHANEGSIECIQYFLNGFGSEFCPLLSESGRGWGIGVKAKEIEQFDPCGGSALGDKEADQGIWW